MTPYFGLADDYPHLSMSMLKRAGVLAAGDQCKFPFVSGSQAFVVATTPNTTQLTVFWTQEGNPGAQSISTVKTQLTFGERLYFVCLITGKR